MAFQVKDNKELWRVVSGALQDGSNQTITIIPASSWFNYYSAIFIVPTNLQAMQNGPSHVHLPEWTPVELDKILSIIKKLKPKKSPGPNGELFKHNPN